MLFVSSSSCRNEAMFSLRMLRLSSCSNDSGAWRKQTIPCPFPKWPGLRCEMRISKFEGVSKELMTGLKEQMNAGALRFYIPLLVGSCNHKNHHQRIPTGGRRWCKRKLGIALNHIRAPEMPSIWHM